MSQANTVSAGRLIVLEGVDGSGKTTLAEKLVAYLISKGESALYMSFPGRDPNSFGEQIYNIHHSSAINQIPATSLQLLHIAAHVATIENQILPALSKGIHVILDRFWWSTWVYGLVDGVNPTVLRAMIEIEKIYWSSLRPAMVFLVSRSIAKPNDNLVMRQRRIFEYQKLSANERNDYPVRRISNDKTLAAALREILIVFIEQGWLPQTKPEEIIAIQEHLPFTLSPAQSISNVTVFTRLSPAKPTLVYESYWKFACERQNIFFSRLKGKCWPWTNDPILREYKFTNAYRASDRVSQYLIKNVIYLGDQAPKEIFFRTILFKIFNRIETWELLRNRFGEITYKKYNFKHYDKLLNAAMDNGDRIYSAAYIMPSGGLSAGLGRKHSMHLRLIDKMLKEELPEKISAAKSMAKAFELIRAYPTIGDFLAYQYVTDLNYGSLTNFSEMEFVIPGPGAFSGIHKCFRDLGGLTPAELIKVVTERQNEEFQRFGLSFKNLWGRSLQLIDCQNLFCEIDKYSRVKYPEFNGPTGRVRIKQRFEPKPKHFIPWYPPKWEINNKIETDVNNVSCL
jgi:thymidylate kinase